MNGVALASAVTLAATWNPRGEYARFLRALPALAGAYRRLAIIVPPPPAQGGTRELPELAIHPQIIVRSPQDWAAGRYAALSAALESGAQYLHYADMDRLLRQIETRPDAWRESLNFLQTQDAVIFGRPPADYATHPRALVETEALSNAVISFLLGRVDVIDVSAGSKGFSRRAAEFIVAHCTPGYALGADGEWPVALHQGGFAVAYHEVGGLDWESADRYRDQAADRERQRQAALAYDRDPENWSLRAAVAHEVIERGLAAVQRAVAARNSAAG